MERVLKNRFFSNQRDIEAEIAIVILHNSMRARLQDQNKLDQTKFVFLKLKKQF